MINDAVHEIHCCAFIHGCKYMDDDCPVENKRISPKYKCQDCEETNEHYRLFPLEVDNDLG